MSKSIYIAGKITGECETPELMKKCNGKFENYVSSISKNPYYIDSSLHCGELDTTYYYGLLINEKFLGTLEWKDYMKSDIIILLQCDEVHFLPDWKESKGAKLEHEIALQLNMKIVYVI